MKEKKKKKGDAGVWRDDVRRKENIATGGRKKSRRKGKVNGKLGERPLSIGGKKEKALRKSGLVVY